MMEERTALVPEMVPIYKLFIANQEIQRLQDRNEELARKLAAEQSAQRWGIGAASRDVERLKRVLLKAGIPLPKLLTDNPRNVEHFEQGWRKTPNRPAVIERDGIWCRYCGKKTTDNTRHIDHVIPVSRGGRTHLDNLAVACKKCNYRKGAHLLEECGMVLLPPRGTGAPTEATVSP